MQHDDTFYIERNKSTRQFMTFGVIMASILALISFLAFQEPTGSSQSTQTLLKWMLTAFWTFIAAMSFAQSGKQSLLINFNSGALSYKYGTPATQRQYFGVCTDVSHLALIKQNISGGRSKYVLKLHWRKSGLPVMPIGVYSDTDKARAKMNAFAKRLGVSCSG